MEIENNVPLPEAKAKPPVAGKTAAQKKADYDSVIDTSPQPPTQKRVRIVLEDNSEIPPTGQFFSVNGRPYILRPNEEAEVPVELLSSLNDAVMEVPIMQGDQVVGYRKRMRFPYRVIAKDI
jgi:hypothetical protein